MNSWFIRIGKAIAVLKNEGAFRGGRRIFVSFVSLFRVVGSGDILFVASGVGDSARYRCHHTAEMLRLRGFKASVTTQDNPFLSRYAEKFSVFVFHRTRWTSRVEELVGTLKRRGKTVLFDADDLVFDEALFKQTAAYRAMNALEKKQYERGIGIEFLEDPSVAAISTSTNFLAEKLRTFGKPVFVVPNRLSEEDVKNAESILQLPIRQLADSYQRPTVSLGYFSGSTGHDRDFATVAPVLVELLKAHSNVRLFIAGPLTLPEALTSFEERITRVSYAPREEHFRNLASVDINVAPLEIGDPFCEAKSELKFFEAGVVGVPTVASSTGTFREAITDGIDGFVAKDEYEWQEKLERLISNPELRKNMGASARETALRRYTTQNVNHDYILFLKSKISRF